MLSRLKTLNRSTKLALTGTLAAALIAAGVGVGVWLAVDSEDPRAKSRALQGPETTYQHVADLCEKIDWSMIEEEFGAIGETDEVERSNSSAGLYTCRYPFGDNSMKAAGAYLETYVSVEASDNEARHYAKLTAERRKFTSSGDAFFEGWDFAKIKGGSGETPMVDGKDAWHEDLQLVIQKGNLIIEMTAAVWTRSKPDTDTPLDDDARTMQIAVSLTDQIEQLSHK